MNSENMPRTLPKDGSIFVLTGRNGTGKTRWLEGFSKEFLAALKIDNDKFQRLICLCGTVQDRFPLEAEWSDNYAYFGRRTSSNMFSEISPYRRLFSYFPITARSVDKKRSEAARILLEKLGMGSQITFRFRRGKNSKERLGDSAKLDLDITFDLNTPSNNADKFRERLQQFRAGKVHVKGVCLNKFGQKLDIMDLSSGERNYALTALALSFSVTDNSTVLFDEPENSLHPTWQASIVKDMWDVISTVSVESKLVIATHSPLIVSGAINDKTYVLNIEDNILWQHSTMYGNSSDVVLREQFGLASPRSMSFLVGIRKCLNALIKAQSDPEPFRSAYDELMLHKIKLNPDDPLFNAMNSIRMARERLG